MASADDLPDLGSSDVDRADLEQAAEELGLGDVSSYDDRALLGRIAGELGVLDEDDAAVDDDDASAEEPPGSEPVVLGRMIEAAEPHHRVVELRSRPVCIRLGWASLEFGGVALSVTRTDRGPLQQVRDGVVGVASRIRGAARRAIARLPGRSGT